MDPTDPTLDLARPRAGSVDRWVRCVVILAVVATLAVVVAFPRVMWARDASSLGLSRYWFENTLALSFTTATIFAWLPGGSRFVRLAVLLPVMQVALMLGTWIAWQLLKVGMPTAVDATPMFDKLPLRVVLPWLALAIGLGGFAVARRRRHEWLHATVMIALVNLLLLGLWLPIASNEWNGQSWNEWSQVELALAKPARMIAFMLVPPFAGALVFTATAVRWPQLWRRNNLVVLALVLLGLVIALACRQDATEIAAFVYVNFVHVMTSAALVTVLALVALGATLWLGNARAARGLERGALVGTITSTHPVAALELTSWLRGLRATCDAFVVTTAFGDVPVPAGARVVMPAPLSTTLLRPGESVPTLRPGDRVALGGFVRPQASGPFRESSAPIPGEGGVTVRRVGAGDERYGFAHVALDLWRPSIAYLVICVACALPGLAALLSEQF